MCLYDGVRYIKSGGGGGNMVPPFMKINKKPNQSTFAAICTINRPQNVCCNLNKQLATKHLLQFAHPATKRLLQFVHPATKRLLQFVHLPHRLSHTGFFSPHRFYVLPHRLFSPHRFYLLPHRLFFTTQVLSFATQAFFTTQVLSFATQAFLTTQVYLLPHRLFFYQSKHASRSLIICHTGSL